MSSLNRLVPDNYQLLISRSEIEQRLQELGRHISDDFENEKPILVGVLNGGFVFLADLIRQITINVEVDFIRISSYGNHQESKKHIKVLKPLSADILDRSVIIVEDIIDSGYSIKFLMDLMTAFKPRHLKIATLLHKSTETISGINVDYIGFEIEDNYVVGYGLDDRQLKRNLKDIYIIKESSV